MLRTTTHPVAHTHRGKSTITGLGWRAQDASPPTVPPPNTLSGENQAAKTSLSKPMGGRFEKSRLGRVDGFNQHQPACKTDDGGVADVGLFAAHGDAFEPLELADGLFDARPEFI